MSSDFCVEPMSLREGKILSEERYSPHLYILWFITSALPESYHGLQDSCVAKSDSNIVTIRLTTSTWSCPHFDCKRTSFCRQYGRTLSKMEP